MPDIDAKKIEELRAERDKLREFAQQATKAITGLAGGGSENFVRGPGEEIYLADVPFCEKKIRERFDYAARLAQMNGRASLPLAGDVEGLCEELLAECDHKEGKQFGCTTRACLFRGGWNGVMPIPLSVSPMCRNRQSALLIRSLAGRVEAERRAKEEAWAEIDSLVLHRPTKKQLADAEARSAALARALEEAKEALRPFSEAASKGQISGYPPFQFCDARDYARARAIMEPSHAD